MNIKTVRFLLIALGVALCIFVLANVPLKVIQELYWAVKIQDIENHAQWWSQLNIRNYKIGVHFTSAMLSYPGSTIVDCSQELVVKDNEVVETTTHACYGYFTTALTVSGLFSLIETNAKSKHCPSESCQCDGPVVVDVVYDGIYHFPKTAKSVHDRGAMWLFNAGGQTPLCMGMSVDPGSSIGLEIYSFIPIQ